MSDFEILESGNSIKVSTGYGQVKLDLGRKATVEDCRAIKAIMNLGARMYAGDIRRARNTVEDLINWRTS